MNFSLNTRNFVLKTMNFAVEKNVNLFARHLHHHVFMNQKHRVVLHVNMYRTYVPLGAALALGLAALGVLPAHCVLLVHARVGWAAR